MKPRTYFNAHKDCCKPIKAAKTYGVPLLLPKLTGIEFAIVRPSDRNGEPLSKGWQVIHVRSGLRVMYALGALRTKAAARSSAMAALEHLCRKIGWPAVVRKLKLAKTPCVLKALKALDDHA